MIFKGSNVYEMANNLAAPRLADIARQAGVISVLQVTAYYQQRRLRHSVARAIEYQHGEPKLEIVYEGFNHHRALRLKLPRAHLESLTDALHQAKFDKLGDQPQLSYQEGSLWLIQRAAGTYCHSIMVAPDVPQLPYSAIVNAIDEYLPIREISLTSYES